MNLSDLKEKGWVCSDDLASTEMCQNLLKQLKNRFSASQFLQAGVGKGHKKETRSEIRKDWIYWLEPQSTEPDEIEFWNWIQTLQNDLIKIGLYNLNQSEFHYAVYPPGGFYEKHVDAFSDDDARTVSIILYLNANWQKGDGGELRIFNEQNSELLEAEIEPVFGRCVLFLSDSIHHQVKMTNRERFTVTGWLKKPPLARF